MDIKKFIDQFDEIASLDRSEQFNLLEQAQHQSFTGFYTALMSALPIFFICVLAAAFYFIFGFASWQPIVALLVGLIISRVMVSEMESRLMSKGLKKVMAQRQPE